MRDWLINPNFKAGQNLTQHYSHGLANEKQTHNKSNDLWDEFVIIITYSDIYISLTKNNYKAPGEDQAYKVN